MKVYTYSQARQNLAQLLDEAKSEGEVQIKRRDGNTFTLKPVTENRSPLDVKGVDTNISLNELNEIVREGRERYTSED